MLNFKKWFHLRKPQARKTRSNVALASQVLEVRCVPTGGTVTAYFNGASIILTGDRHNNNVTVDISESGVDIQGNDDTTIKFTGKAIPSDFGTTLPGSVLVYLYGGNDSIEINSSLEGLTIGGGVVVDLGSGNDSASFQGTAAIKGGLSVYGGTGADGVSIVANDLSVGGSILVSLGSGAEQGAFIETSEGGSLSVGGSILLYGGNEAGGDALEVFAAVDSTIAVKGGIVLLGHGGNDFLSVGTGGGTITVGGVISANGGNGHDFVVVDGDNAAIGNASFGENESEPGDQTISALGVYLYGGSGNDSIGVTGTSTQYDLFVDAGVGNDTVGAANVSVGLNLYVYGQTGNDQIGADTLSVNGNSFIFGGTGNDSVAIDDATFGGIIQVFLSTGNDQLAIGENVSVDGHVLLDGGPGTDEISPSVETLRDFGFTVNSFESETPADGETIFAAIQAEFTFDDEEVL